MSVATLSIHTSDRATFKHCRRKWDFTSPIRQNLQPKISSFGVQWPLWFGTGIHKVLEMYYDSIANPQSAYIPMWQMWQEWYAMQVVEIHRQAPGYYEENIETFDKHLDLGLGMMRFYEQYATSNDKFTMIEPEHDFSVPLDPTILTASHPVYGPPNPILYEGRMDGLIQDDQGRIGILETKTASSITEDYLAKLDMDEQCTSYLWAAQHEGHNAEFVLYNILAKHYPKPPTVLKNGTLSVDRSQGTTSRLFLEAALDNNLVGTDWWSSERVVNYREFLDEQGDSLFITRKKVLRNQWQIDNCGKRIAQEVQDMLSDPHVYPNPTGNWECIHCAFRPPCLQMEDGSDPTYTLEENYEARS